MLRYSYRNIYTHIHTYKYMKHTWTMSCVRRSASYVCDGNTVHVHVQRRHTTCGPGCCLYTAWVRLRCRPSYSVRTILHTSRVSQSTIYLVPRHRGSSSVHTSLQVDVLLRDCECTGRARTFFAVAIYFVRPMGYTEAAHPVVPVVDLRII